MLNLKLIEDAPKDAPILVSEIFSPTFQGEGPSLGERCAFVRLGACNLTCYWCDTPFTWRFSTNQKHRDQRVYDPGSLVRMSTNDILSTLGAMEGGIPSLVVISGGEPMLQANRLTDLLKHLKNISIRAHVETNGTVNPGPLFDPSLIEQYVVSLKLASSGMAESTRLIPKAILWYRNTYRAVWKFVVTNPDELDEVEGIVTKFNLNHPWQPVWIMPEGTDPATVLTGMRTLADPVAKRGWNLTTRLHILIWSAERGR